MFDPFADLNRGPKTKCSNGWTDEDLARTAHFIYQKIVSGPISSWHSVAELDQIPWKEMAALAISLMDLPTDEQATIEISAKGLAKALYSHFLTARGLSPAWESQPAPVQLAWEGVGRHLANLIDSDGSIEFADMEERILNWADSKSVVL